MRMINSIAIPAVLRLSRDELARLSIGGWKLYSGRDTFHKWRTSFLRREDRSSIQIRS